MDRRTVIFLALTSSVCVCALVCAVGSVGVPLVKRLTVVAYRGALLSAVAAFVYRLAYSFKLEGGYSLTALRSAVQPLAASNGFQYTLYALLFLTGRPVPTVLFPLVVCSAYQVATIAHKHFGDSAVYQRVGGARAFTYMQENMHRALMMCATMEVSVLLLVLMELVTPARSVTRVVMYVNVLRAKYACTDNTVFRIKFTYYNTGFYHQQVWAMIGEKLAPVTTRAPAVLTRPLGMAKAWFTGMAAKPQEAPAPKKEE